MSPTYRFLMISVLLAACGGRPAQVSKPAPSVTDGPATLRPATVEIEPSDTRWADAGASYSAVFDGLINVRGIAELPDPSFPGRDFHVGVFDEPAAWARFTKAAEIDPFGPIDWTEKVVVYTVLDVQTNMLGLQDFSTDGDVGSMQILWVRIEPHYVDSSPAVLMLIDRDAARQVRIAADGLPLGTVML